MSDIIPFPQKFKQDPVLIKLLQISDEFDSVILTAMQDGHVEPKEVIGLMAHRLGTFLAKFEEGKEDLWEVCRDIAKREAGLVSQEKGAS